MVMDFFSIHVDKRTGDEIPLKNFSVFKNLSIVTDDRVNVEDLTFLFSSIKKMKGNTDVIDDVYQYFFQNNYPWFYVPCIDLPIEEKIERI